MEFAIRVTRIVLIAGSLFVQASTTDRVYNDELLVDSIQLNPGDAYGNQPSKYTDPRHLRSLGFNARSSSMEQTPALCLNFKRADRVPEEDGIVAGDQTMAAWMKAYCRGMDTMIQETVEQDLQMLFFTDMIVFPVVLLRRYPEIVRINTTSTIQWNNFTEYLLEIMFDEWFQRFPGTNGIVIRTGETYTFDTPFHVGSSPIAGVQRASDHQNVWINFINLLRNIVCVKHGRQAIFRTWDSVESARSYLQITSQILPHKLLYFAIKHTTGDFFRQMPFNDMLGIGNHAQIVEVQIQREYEGKGSYPLYIFEHIVFGDASSRSKKSLSQLFPNGRNESSIVKGLWTWSRGGGWWGPYIHGAEFWIDLNLQLFLSWWKSNCTASDATVADLFQNVCRNILVSSSTQVNPFEHDGSMETRHACTRLRASALIADQAMLYGRYCMEIETPGYGACWIWTRDDRIGGLGALSAHLEHLRGNETLVALSLKLKRESLELWERAFRIYEVDVGPIVAALSPRLNRQIRSSFVYGQSYFCIVESSWRALLLGELGDKSLRTKALVHQAIGEYDECWAAFKGTALSTPEFPSLYKGISWNFPFQREADGMDASIDKLRDFLTDWAETEPIIISDALLSSE